MRFFALFSRIVIVVLCLLCFAEGNSARFQGTLVDGVDLSSLQAGGSTLSVVLQLGRFKTDLAEADLVNFVASGFECEDVPFFSESIKTSLSSGFVLISNTGKQLKLRLGPMPNLTFSRDLQCSFTVPKELFGDAVAEIKVRSTIFVGTQAAVTLLTKGPIVVGAPVSVRFSGVQADRVTIVQGATCRGDQQKGKIASLVTDSAEMSFVPKRGGVLSFCFQEGEKQLQVKGTVTISGAEGFSTEPSQPRSNKQFFVHLFGTDMSEQDVVALTRLSCSKIDTIGFEMFDFEFLSPSRAGFAASVTEGGDFHVCYQRSGGDIFMDLGTISVEKGGDAVIDTDSAEITVTSDTLVLKSVKISSLVVLGGSLLLDHFHLNVSRFEWRGGSIYGPGSITVLSDRSLINHKNAVIDFSLRNMGRMELFLGTFTISGGGSVHNLNKMYFESQTGASTVIATHDHNSLKNGASGTVFFRGSAGVTYDLKSTFINFGRIVIEGTVKSSVFVGHRGSIVEVDSESAFEMASGVLQGECSLGTSATLTIRSLGKRSVEMTGVFFRLAESSVLRVSSGEVFLHASRFEGSGIISFGDSSELALSLDGTTIFAFGTAVGFSNTRLVSPRGSILSFYGNVAINLENTVVGDNVVIQSRLAAVMFAKGNDRTKVIPQSAPQNTSLIVPANTTLVIVDTGNRTQEELLASSATPVVCSYYVVVPMYVAADGDILLRGCAMLPYGGTLNGVVHGSNVDILEASIKTAFCKTALFGGSGCAPPSNAGGSGLVLGGQFRADAIGESSFDVGFLRLSNATLGVGKQLSLQSPFLQVDSGSTLLLENGGLLTVDSFELRGLLQVDNGVAIRGNLDARGGSLRLPPSSNCYFPVTVDGETLYADSLVQCSAPPLTPTTGALIRSGTSIGEPSVDQKSCAVTSMVAHVLLDQQSGLTLQVTEKAFHTTTSQKILWGAFSAVLIGFLLFAAGFRRPSELVQKPPIAIDLLWTEFSMFIPNLMTALGYFAEIVVLCAPAFLHSVPNTPIFGWFSRMASAVIEPRDSVSAPPLSVLCAFLIFMWALTWLPFSWHIYRKNVHQSADDYRIGRLFRLHTIAVLVVPPLFVPTLSMLLETVACNTVYYSAQSCYHMHIAYWPFLLAAILLVCLSPFSGANESFPFSHPPYQRDLDIRFKRSYVYVRFAILTLLVCMWKISGADRAFIVGFSLILTIGLFGLTLYSNPSGYKNVNTLCSFTLLYPCWAQFSALFSELHSTQVAVCPDTDYVFIVMIVIGWLLISVAVYWMSGDSNTNFSEHPEIAAQLRMIMEGSQYIEECRNDMYDASSDRERDAISRKLSDLKLHHLRHLTVFRNTKEALLLAYYLGEVAGKAHFVAPNELTESDDVPEGFHNVTKAAPVPIEEDSENAPLTVELMDTYVRGPQLGSGSYGAVYMGMLSTTGRLCAVKEVRISSKKKDALAQVKKEVDLLGSLSHPNIVRYFGCRNKGGMMYVFMEFATGGSLTSLVKKFGCLQEAVVGMYAQQILTGLAFLHSKEIVHRDIKGDNILIDNRGVAKLADFGCSKMLADMANASEEGCATLIGSPYWMAPEVIRSEAYGKKADIWSVGCTVVEMLNGGEPAWRERFETAYQVMYYIGHSTDKCPTNIPDSVSEGCRDFLSRCFERDVLKRADAMELLDHPWLREAQSSPMLAELTTPESVSMESMARSLSPSAEASFEREMSSFA